MVFWLCLGMTMVGCGEAVPPPGVVIDYSPATSRNYIGSPALAVLDNGNYVAAHDFFGPGPKAHRTAVFGSKDRGGSWQKLAEVCEQFWSSLFVHRGKLYLLGTTKESGFVVIRGSDDGGKTWTTPVDATSGLLLAEGKYHCAPVPVVVHGGRIWRAMEDTMGPGKWGAHFRAFVFSAAEDADLLKASSWSTTNRLGRNPAWLDGKFGGWLEGNFVVGRKGDLYDILRVDFRTDVEKAALIRVLPGKQSSGFQLEFDPTRDFVDFPGGCKKFTIRFDEKSKRYWTLSNAVAETHRGSARPDRVRNALYLCASSDLRRWEPISLLLYHADSATHAFQYVDWHFDGDDIIAVSRTAWDDSEGGAHNQHDANFMTFHRFGNFRGPGRLWPPTHPVP